MKSNFHKGHLVFILVGVCFLIPIDTAEAANFCASTTAQIQIALNTAASNGQGDVIKIVQGTYVGNFVYSSSENFGLTIEGGYTTGCSSRTMSPGNTILDVAGTGRALMIESNSTKDFSVNGITVQNAANSGLYVTVSQGRFFLTNSIVQNNLYPVSNGEGGGARIGALEAMFSQNTFSYNYANAGGAAKISAKRIDLRDNSFFYNTAGTGGAIDIQDSAEEITFTNNSFTFNETNDAEGGGIHIKYVNARVNFINNLIAWNATTKYIGGGHGGGAHISTYGPVSFINNTVVGNTANPTCCCGGGITIYYSAYPSVYNNVFWGNNAQTGRDICFYQVIEPNLVISYNDIDQNPGGISGIANYIFDPSNLNHVDPMFTNPSNQDYHLQNSSPCINAGYSYLPLLPATDKDGNPRIVNGVIDMGVYEYQGNIFPTNPDLFGVLKEFHYYKYGEKIVVKIEILNRGLKAGPFKVSFYLSENGKTLDRLIDEEVFKKGLKSNSSEITSAEYDSSTTLSGKYIIAIVDSGNQIAEMIETNNRISIRIP